MERILSRARLMIRSPPRVLMMIRQKPIVNLLNTFATTDKIVD